MFIGSVFSPYYVWSGKNDPLNHVAVNVALYGRPSRWAMTERGRRRAHQADDGFSVKASRIRLDGGVLRVSIDERCAPIPRKLRGEVVLRPDAWGNASYPIDRAGEHRWRPIAPAAPVEVTMEEPALNWRGTGYFDMNWGSCPLEETFSHWHWMRADLGGGHSAIFYETEERGGGGERLALKSAPDGSCATIDPPSRHPLPRTLWQVPRAGWSEDRAPTIRRTLEDTPFYVRTELDAQLFGERRTAIQESLSLTRFKNPAVLAMLPFRMPRLP